MANGKLLGKVKMMFYVRKISSEAPKFVMLEYGERSTGRRRWA